MKPCESFKLSQGFFVICSIQRIFDARTSFLFSCFFPLLPIQSGYEYRNLTRNIDVLSDCKFSFGNILFARSQSQFWGGYVMGIIGVASPRVGTLSCDPLETRDKEIIL